MLSSYHFYQVFKFHERVSFMMCVTLELSYVLCVRLCLL